MIRRNNTEVVLKESGLIALSLRDMREGILDATIEETKGMILCELAEDINQISLILNSYIREISQVISHYSAGDMTEKISSEITFKGDFLPIKNALKKLDSSLNQTFTDIHGLSVSIDTMCNDIDLSSETVANNAVVQAGIVEKLVQNMEEMDRKTVENTEHSMKAFEYSKEALMEARDGNNLMNEIISKLQTCKGMVEMDQILKAEITSKGEVECFFVNDSNGIQVSHTIMNQDLLDSDTLDFKPSNPGDSHLSKKYFRQAVLKPGVIYSSQDYISGATGKLCRTVSCSYQNYDQNTMILCADISCEF